MLRVGNKQFSFITLIMFLLILPHFAQIAFPHGHQATPLALDPEVLQPIAADLEH
jgi:hypothetical protein